MSCKKFRHGDRTLHLSILLFMFSVLNFVPETFASKGSSHGSLHLPGKAENAQEIEDVPKVVKIFDNPSPNDGYESLRTFSSGLMQGMFKKQLYNTSIALTAGLLSYQLPSNSDSEETTVNMANQTIFGMFAMLTGVLIFALPVLLTGTRFNPGARSNSAGDSGIMARILEIEPIARLIKNDFHKKIGLEPEKCLQKTICEAHRFPENAKYGMLAIPFQIFYPPLSKDADQSRATSFQEAAKVGKFTKTKCGRKYSCFFDVLPLGRYLMDWYQYHNGSPETGDV